MITKMHIENFKCFKDFDIELGPFNVLIGPNDSGKTALLQVIQLAGAMSQEPRKPWGPQELGRKAGFDLGPDVLWRGETSNSIRIRIEGKEPLHLTPSMGFYLLSSDGSVFKSQLGTDQDLLKREMSGNTAHEKEWLSENIGRVACYRLDPIAMRAPSEVFAELEQTGRGLATFLDDIHRSPDREAFRTLEADFYRRFPFYRSILIDKTRIKTQTVHPDRTYLESDDGFILKFKTVHEQLLPAHNVSDGVILSLGFIALSHQGIPPRILLIEEPENGVHYGSLKEIVATLKHLSLDKGVQVIATTHSPYLLDLIEPEEVRVFAKDEEGAVHAARLSDYPEVEKLRKHFMTGELWTEFDEADIVKAKGGGNK